MTLQALIFDVDGTMADTEEGHRTAFNLAFERFGLPWQWGRPLYRELLAVAGGKERLKHYIGRLDLGDAERARLLARVPDLHAEKTRFYSALAADGGVPLRPGILRLMAEARAAGLRIAIASTTTRANIDALLRAAGWPDAAQRFDAIACGDQVTQKKPAPDIYRLAMSLLDADPARSIAFEDSINGLKAATAAGLVTVITPTSWTEEQDFTGAAAVHADLSNVTLDELRSLVLLRQRKAA